MTIEEIELRKLLSQMLADNGINRETIVDFVKDIIDTKIESAIARIVHDKDLDTIINNRTETIIKASISNEVQKEVRRILNYTSITIEHKQIK